MSKLVVALIAGAAGVGLGIFIAKNAYENKVRTGVGGALDKVGLGGGVVEDIADKLLGVG